MVIYVTPGSILMICRTPFKIDTLGIITILGADSLRASISRLVPNQFAEYLPLLTAQIFADNTIADSVSGFTLHNITDGILATDLSTWWTRWLLCQKLNWNTTTLQVIPLPQPQPLFTMSCAVTINVNFVINGGLVVIPVLSGDWYGFAVSVALVVTAITRAYMLFSLRRSVDHLVSEAEKQNKDPVTLFLTLPNGRAVTVFTTRGIATNVLLTEPRPLNHVLYLLFRAITWLAFGVLIVCLGSACLCNQLIIIVTILVSTMVVACRFGCDECHIGRRLEIVQDEFGGEDIRSNAYRGLNLSEEQEDALVNWHLLPMRFNTFWWNRYRNRQLGLQKTRTPRYTTATGRIFVPPPAENVSIRTRRTM